ncbi:PadR family transcriptional regulator [Desulfofundulus thermosubterraneus]|uniref:Transcriptional regulator, PadR family n=1 Tax=Desulfofundulus thermosubterraneus DSM 16057 TaxID=1121432 RepID=A0A1M6M6Y4_9FIRM|nr:PadR family transcriptional regulator [Desulfofundulus thermosubterraneus]SHJ79212.1 transcriptional regulator, PadR family [Desulfofundulus thermosubterraneus DSM 16057]
MCKNDCSWNLTADRLLQPVLLFLLRLKPSHGYELIQRLAQLDLLEGEADPATVYRNLRRMEQEGLVISSWEATGTGPARRRYAVTPKGDELLDAWMVAVRRQKEKLEKFIQLYEKNQYMGNTQGGENCISEG